MKQVRCKECGDYVEVSESHCPYCGEPMNAFSKFGKKVSEDIHTDHLEHEGDHQRHRGHIFNQAEKYEKKPYTKPNESNPSSDSTFDFSDLEKMLKNFTGSNKKDGKRRGIFGTIIFFYIIFNILMGIFRSIADF